MVYSSPKELLSEIKHIMDLRDIQMKELAVLLGKSPQSVSQIFKYGNPKCTTLFEICNALNIELNIEFKNTKGDTK